MGEYNRWCVSDLNSCLSETTVNHLLTRTADILSLMEAAGPQSADLLHKRPRVGQGKSLMFQGGFGKCYELFNPLCGTRYACKVIDKAALISIQR